ncbi:hypothetical protein AArcSl_0075 [Halalkaliarchaeum desulfuricum]|uniref:Uncharacterized protein n=1 Tax=Halalkaliarchaeum desulfuricum TaxID=2055893 RepID=A0A343TF61_9EURY|nr:hypothetical protein AArcSl_0075 [Halalkaliarchaeum desulfuricum]
MDSPLDAAGSHGCKPRSGRSRTVAVPVSVVNEVLSLLGVEIGRHDGRVVDTDAGGSGSHLDNRYALHTLKITHAHNTCVAVVR